MGMLFILSIFAIFSIVKSTLILPQIFSDNVHIGDCDKIYKLDQEKKLDKLLGLA